MLRPISAELVRIRNGGPLNHSEMAMIRYLEVAGINGNAAFELCGSDRLDRILRRRTIVI